MSESEVRLGVIPESEERMLDAQAIEDAAKSITRPTAMLQVYNLVTKIRRDAKALQRTERSKAKAEAGTVSLLSESAVSLKPESAVQLAAVKDLSVRDNDGDASSSGGGGGSTVFVSNPASMHKYTSIDRFAFDSGKYDSPTVTLYVSLPGVGALPKENVTCEFTNNSFDLIVDFGSTSAKHRLFRDNLFKDVQTDKCKYIVKKDKVVVKLSKIKGEYGSYDSWTELTAKKKKSERAGGKENPTDSIMGLMKDMYDSGDDKMKKMIGETMLKQRNGDLSKPGMDDMDMDMDKM